jgi:uncharacterized membrane protein YkvA (DUF1232 family)
MFRHIKDFFLLYTSLAKDPRVPSRSKWLPWAALIYLISPIDIVPDLIPLLGQADDITVIITLLWIAISAISDKTYAEHKKDKYPDAIDVTHKGSRSYNKQ